MTSLFEAAGGESGIYRLAEAWHQRVLADDIVAHAFSHGFREDHTERLAAYWIEALGGPTAYSQRYGDEITVISLHSGNGLHDEMDRRAIECFDDALVDIGISPSSDLWKALHDYFEWATLTEMTRMDRAPTEEITDGSIPKWSWDGQQSL